MVRGEIVQVGAIGAAVEPVFQPFVPRIVFFFNDTATTQIYTLSLRDALPISSRAAMYTLRLVEEHAGVEKFFRFDLL